MREYKFYKTCGFGWILLEEGYAKTLLHKLIGRKDFHETVLVVTHNCAWHIRTNKRILK